ncbi:ribonuclease Z [Methanohalobium evestigatum Z-7303]|uniref:Ribonuclease Z n=1 Tax=Methanohalobium evestigatum (strain ATCC BAA-1072 / DSM 3721 / NBRC 107634 / OCM 161 / Z-7303) TaxID=644295 RepID=D7E699_METEZ|nr:ribonuclease Z [Methanohalobium evestigatum]ADI73121.1 ribonuclease Z [Methanohalobium evestigatum Z-7303]
MLKITFLGTAGSLPTPYRNPPSILIKKDSELLMFDCGEGAQQQMMRARTGMMSLSSIFITHFHADHVLGIPGLLQTMSFQGRTEPLYIYGPEKIDVFIQILTALGYCQLGYEIKTVELKPGDIIEKNGYHIKALKTEHGVKSIGYSLVENKRPGKFDRDKAVSLGVPPGPLFSKLQKGNPVEVDGRTVHPEEVVGEPRPGRTVVYSGDTRPCEDVFNASLEADVLIHDGSLDDSQSEWAAESMHSTASEAAELAKKAGVIKLVLTHISSRYTEDESPLLNDANEIFENVVIADDLMEINIPYKK